LVGGDQSLKVPNTDNFSAVPLPGAAWLFSSVVVGFTLISRRKNQHA
jgi:hypothetical protein